MADTHYYPFRLTDTVLTDSDFGFGSGVFGGWISDLEDGIKGAAVVYQWAQAHHTDTIKAGETTAQNVNTHLLDLVVSVTTKIDLDAIVFDVVDLADITVQNFDSYHTDTIKAGETTAQSINAEISDSVNVADSTKQEFEAKPNEEIKVSDSTKQEFTSNHTDTVNPGESMKHEFDYSESIEVEDSTKQEFEAKPNESLTVWEYDQNYLDKANPTASGTSETKPTASGTSETKPRASGIGIKDVDD